MYICTYIHVYMYIYTLFNYPGSYILYSFLNRCRCRWCRKSWIFYIDSI